jgi:hypothetical protein
MSAGEIAARLTGKQAAAVRGIYRWDSHWEQEEGEAALYMMGIWNPHPKRSEGILTPLGLEVRNHLTKGTSDD